MDAQGAKTLNQLHRGEFAHLAVGVPNDRDALAAFKRAGQRQRAHGAAERAGDDVARVAQPDELLLGHAQHLRQQTVEPHVNARQRHQRQLALEVRRVYSRRGVTGQRPVIGVNDGF